MRREKENSDLYYTRIKIFSNWLFLPQLSALANLSFTQCREIGRGEKWGERRERERERAREREGPEMN